MAAVVRNQITAYQKKSPHNPWHSGRAVAHGGDVGIRPHGLPHTKQIVMSCSREQGGARGSAAARIRGITLIELMVTLSIVAILAVIATPSFTGIIQKARLQTEANSLVNDLQFARSESIKRGLPVSLCPSTNGTTCSTAKPYAWEQGWIVFNDDNGSGSLDATTDAPLRVRPALANGDTFTPTPSASAVVYSRDGFATNLSKGTVTMKLTTSPPNNNAMQCVEINMAGRQRVLTQGTASCN